MAVTLRPYQIQALDAVHAHLANGGAPALVDMATATGKSLIIAETVRRQLIANPVYRVLVAAHVRELIEQNVAALLSVWPDAPFGICSDGLGRRDHDHPIIFGTIQTLFRDANRLGRRDLMLIDEAHLVPREGDGMYLSLLASLRARTRRLHLLGLSATCFRLDSGYLHQGDGALFERVIFSYGIKDGIKDGYLSKLSSKATATRIDVTGVGRRGGDFIPGQLEQRAIIEEVVRGAAAEIVQKGADRRAWLCFCVGIDHAFAVRDAIRAHGFSCETVTGDTPSDERRTIFSAYRAGEIRCLTGVNVFSTGFDIPQVDLIALLRPTCSPGLLIQQVGRGTRLAPGKADCLVLDFAGNIRRHGPVDDITVNGRLAAGPGDVLSKTCPECQEENALSATECACCGHIFVSAGQRAIRHAAVADDAPILSSPPRWLPVRDSTFRAHYKASDPHAPPTLRVDHLAGFESYSEFISFEGSPGARRFALDWWQAHGGRHPSPLTVAAALDRRHELAQVVEIVVKRDGQWWRIDRRRVRMPSGVVVEIDARYRQRGIAA